MFGNQQVFNDVFTPIKSTNGVYRYIVPTSSTLAGIRKSMNFSACQPLTSKRYAKDYCLVGKIDFSATFATAGGSLDLIGDLNKAMRCTVSINDAPAITSEPELQWYLENYAGIYEDASFGTDYESESQKIYTNIVGAKLYSYNFVCRFANPALIGTLGGVNKMDIMIEFPDDIKTLIYHKPFQHTNQGPPVVITDGTVEISSPTFSDVRLRYVEYDGGSEIFAKKMPFYTFHKTAELGVLANDTESTIHSGRIANTKAPVKLCTMVIRKTNNDQSVICNKALKVKTYDASINGRSNILNVSTIQELFAVCKSAGYKGTFSDFTNTKNIFRYGATDVETMNTSPLTSIVCINCKDLALDIGTLQDNFDYVGDIKVKNTTGKNTANYEYFLATILVQNAVLSLNPQRSEVILTGSMDGVEVGDYQALLDASEVEGGGFFDTIKSGFKGLIRNAPKLINTASQIANAVAPNSKFNQTMGKVSNVASILGDNFGQATQVF